MDEYKFAIFLIIRYNLRPSDFKWHPTYKEYLYDMQYADEEQIMTNKEFYWLRNFLRKNRALGLS